MAGRNRLPRQPEGFRDFRDRPRPVMHRGGPGPIPLHPAALEEELEIQHRDIQRILTDNRHVVEENVLLQRELAAAKDEIHRLGQIIPKLRADKEGHTRELIDRGLKLEGELRNVEPMRAEVSQLRVEAQRLNAMRQDLSSQVQTLTKDVSRLKGENKQLSSLKADVDGMQKELMEARRVIEFEKKAHEEQMEQKQTMEKNLVSIAREIEKLRSEQLASADRRAHGFGGGNYGAFNGSSDARYGSTEARYGGGPYGDVYGSGAWDSYDKRGPPRR